MAYGDKTRQNLVKKRREMERAQKEKLDEIIDLTAD